MHEKVVKKQTSQPFKVLAIIPKLRNKENLSWSWREETAPDIKTEILEFIALSGSRSQVTVKFGLVTSCEGTAMKLTNNRDARAKLLCAH